MTTDTTTPACPVCGLPTATIEEAIDGSVRYGDTQGGHNDRHTLVVEAAERLIEAGREPE